MLADHPNLDVTSAHGESVRRLDTTTFSTRSPAAQQGVGRGVGGKAGQEGTRKGADRLGEEAWDGGGRFVVVVSPCRPPELKNQPTPG